MRTEYDSQGRAVRQFDGLGVQTVEITYGLDGTRTITDALGLARSDVYDGRGTLVEAANPAGETTTKSVSIASSAPVPSPTATAIRSNWPGAPTA